jgi:hypothetical protein
LSVPDTDQQSHVSASDLWRKHVAFSDGSIRFLDSIMQHEHGEFAGDTIYSLTLEIMVVAIDIRPQDRGKLPSVSLYRASSRHFERHRIRTQQLEIGIFSQLEFYQVIIGARVVKSQGSLASNIQLLHDITGTLIRRGEHAVPGFHLLGRSGLGVVCPV